MKKVQNGFVKRTTAIVLLVIGVFLAGVMTMLPQGFSDDLSLIGKGSAAVVLTHDKNYANSQATMELLNKIRPDYEPSVNFIVVDVAEQNGQEFMRQQQVGAISLSFFGSDGKRVNLLSAGATESTIRKILASILAG